MRGIPLLPNSPSICLDVETHFHSDCHIYNSQCSHTLLRSLPDKMKRMSLNEKKMVHTLMSCTRGSVYDEDPGCIVESSCISVREREGRTAS